MKVIFYLIIFLLSYACVVSGVSILAHIGQTIWIIGFATLLTGSDLLWKEKEEEEEDCY